MNLRRVVLLCAVVFISAACGAAGVAPPVPTPTPPGGTGSVSGTVGVSVSLARTRARLPGARVNRNLWQAPPGAPQVVPDELLVKMRPGTAPADAAGLHRRLGTVEVRRLPRTGVSVVKITSGESVQAVMGKYRGQPSVLYAEPSYYRYLAALPPRTRPRAVPNDTFYGLQWHYQNVNLPAAWDVTTGSSLVVVAVIDTGILAHADLAGVTVAGYDFYGDDTNPADPGCPNPTDLSHGSHVAGTIAAATNNGQGVAGVNWGGPGKTKIMPLRVFGNYGGACTATSADIIAAIEYAADHSARVINMSFGGGGFNASEQAAVTYAYNTGVILVAAAGNSNADCGAFYPASYANVVGVSATDLGNAKAWYSNFGSCVDLAAPGGDTTADDDGDGNPDGVLSTSGTPASPSEYWFFQGTSMATPHAVGLAALLISKGVTGPAAIQSLMQSTATDLGAGGYDPIFGWGLINAAAAVGAPATTNPMRAFSGDLSGSTITVTSDMVTVNGDGTYLVTNAQAGTHSVFAWQDANGSGIIDVGDLYDEVTGVVITPGTTTPNVNPAVTERPIGSPPITVVGPQAVPRRR